MRRTVLLLLTAVLAALVFARGTLPEPAAEAMAGPVWDPGAYNALELDLSQSQQTAGSALIAEMSSHFLSRRPTAKHAYTGRLAGRDLIVLLAPDWRPGEPDGARTPALYRLWREGTRFAQVYAPDWYQGLEGREFALLTGLVPTNVQNLPPMSLLSEKDICLPFSLAASLARAGYVCRACPAGEGQEAAYIAAGFASVTAGSAPEEQVAELAGADPFFLYAVLPDTDAEAALERLFAALEDEGLTDTAAICLVTGGEDLRGGLYLWARDMAGVPVAAPCSELDVTPTLLDLFGVGYDARFLAGRDVLADGTDGGPTPPVCLYGSAYSDWVSDAGSYLSAEDRFIPADGQSDAFPAAERRYVLQARQQIYDQYVYSRRVLECDYFRLALAGGP